MFGNDPDYGHRSVAQLSSRKLARISTLVAVFAATLVSLGSTAHAATPAAPTTVVTAIAELPVHEKATSVAQVKPTSYTVQPGDVLSRIASRFCGTASAYRSIGAASGITNLDLIYPGQVVTLKCTGGVAAPAPKVTPRVRAKVAAKTASVAIGGSIGAVISYAEAQVGKRYVWAAAGPNSFDCSGLVMAAFARAGVKLPHQSGGIAGLGRPVSGALQAGDVLFLSDKSGHVYHVILYVGNGQIVEAADESQGVIKHGIYKYSFARRLM